MRLSVDCGPAGPASIEIDVSAARFYALAPVSRSLADAVARVQPYAPETGGLGPAVDRRFAAIDLDLWLRDALEAIELVLGTSGSTASDQDPASAGGSPAVTPLAETVAVITRAKRAIAGLLSELVAEILDGGDPSPDGLAAARDTLRERMLGSLANAYSTDAVVQFPVTVGSPFTTGATTGPADGLSELAIGYRISPEAVAEALADVPAILATGTTVGFGGREHTLGANDTLASLAAVFDVDLPALPAGLTTPSGQGLFTAGKQLVQAPLTRTLSPGDTFASLSGRFATTPGRVGRAVADVPGLLAAGRELSAGGQTAGGQTAGGQTAAGRTVGGRTAGGQTVGGQTVGGQTYVVRAEDTLRDVAARLGTDAQTLAARADLVSDPGLLTAGTQVRSFSPLYPTPPWVSGELAANLVPAVAGVSWAEPAPAFSTAGVPLADGRQFLDSLMRVAHGSNRSSLLVALSYAICRTEPCFEPTGSPVPAKVEEPADQAASFVRAATLELGEVCVPVPLRGHPQPAAVVRQNAVAATPDPPTVTAAKQWRLEAEVLQAARAQDEVYIRATFGGLTPPTGDPTPVDEGLFEALAGFHSVWPDLRLDLPGTTEIVPSAGYPRNAAALVTFATLVVGLAAALTSRRNRADPADRADGADGADALAGADGADAVAGADGADAVAGADGADAVAGADAADGADGSDGAGARSAERVRPADPKRGQEGLEPDGATASYTFRIAPGGDAVDPGYLATLELTAVDAAGGAIPWPAITVSGDIGRLPSAAPTTGPRPSRTYHYPPETVSALTPPPHLFAFPGTPIPPTDESPVHVDAVRWPSGHVAAAVLRNAALVPGRTTAAAFVYTTPWTGPPTPAEPRLTAEIGLPLAGGPGLAAPLVAVLTALLTDAGSLIAGDFGVALQCELVRPLEAPDGSGGPGGPGGSGGPARGPFERIPVFLIPRVGVSLAEVPGFAGIAEAQADRWLAELEPAVGPGVAFVLELELFRNDLRPVDPPVLVLRELRVELG